MLSNASTQITVMSKLRHPNIVQVVETYQSPTHYFLVMELMAGGKLSTRLEDQVRALRGWSM